MPTKYIAFLLLLIMSIKCLASTSQDSTKNFSLTAFPLVYYLPESSFGFGGAGIATFRFKGESIETRPSSFQFGATYTLKKQILLFLPFELYKMNEEYRLVGELGYFKYFYNFYGIGGQSSLDDLENYDVKFPRVRATFLKKIRGAVSVGLTYQFDKMNITKVEPGGILDNEQPTGHLGGVVSNVGAQILFDTRDNYFYPYKGSYIQLDLLSSSNLLGSDFNYQKIIFDARHFIQTGNQSAIGFHLYTGHISGDSPFFDMFYYGTPLIGRGIGDRRFMDNNIYAFQSEYRFPIYKRFGGVLFGTLNSVSSKYLNFDDASFTPSVGVGLRINVNKKERNQVRIDVGYNKEGINFYATASNAF